MSSNLSAGAKTLRTFAEVYAKPGLADELWEQISRLVTPTRAEVGNISYEVLRARDDHNHFLFFEEWADQASIDAHIASAHIAEYLEGAKDLVDGELRVVIAESLTS